MKSIAGIFQSRAEAEQALAGLVARGVPRDQISFVMPGTTPEELGASVTTSDTEQPGVGKAIGAVVGGAAGAAAGPLGAAAVSLLIPGIGPVLAVGLAASAIFGVGGAIAGAAAGGALEDSVGGVPRDELFVYEDALRQGRTVLFVSVDDDRADEVRDALDAAGAESVDAAREQWWVGLRSAEKEEYHAAEAGDFDSDEERYRRGFEAALRADAVRAEDVDSYLRSTWPDHHSDPAFRRGFERGRAYYRGLDSNGVW